MRARIVPGAMLACVRTVLCWRSKQLSVSLDGSLLVEPHTLAIIICRYSMRMAIDGEMHRTVMMLTGDGIIHELLVTGAFLMDARWSIVR